MSAVLKLVTPGTLAAGFGCGLLAAFIWYAGPYFAFGSYRPLASVVARLVAIALVVVVWGVVAIVRRVRARRADAQLASALVEQSQRDAGPSAEAARIRESFEEGIASLERTRRSGRGLYELPWYVFIGAPGSGKTTALVNSGLRFSLEQRGRAGALRGVGGTRNCDWWFTDEAVFLDTAGRFLTQDSDASTDAAGWNAFLELLQKHRGRRPINGVILTISAHDLLVQSETDREAYVEAARRRLDEINRQLRIRVPVYVVVTKCDLIAGFAEYFDDLTREGRAQVWGVTFPIERSAAGDAARLLPKELDALVARLNERLFGRVEEDRDVRRRTRIFAFPQQVAGLRDALSHVVEEVFASTRFDQQVLLRGVYFTSGTQEGTPIDRLLGAMGRRLAAAPEAVAQGGRGKAYFIEQLLRDVLFAESGLAGVNRRVAMRLAAAQVGAYAALAAAALLGTVAIWISYGRNRSYISDVRTAVEQMAQVPPVAPGASIDQVLARLDAVQAVDDVAGRHRSSVPLSMRWGLYQGKAVGDSARDAYVRELNALLMPQVKARFERRLETVADAEVVYDYLKAYLMLGGQAPEVDAAFIAALERENRVPDDRLAGHVERLVGEGLRVRSMPLNDLLVEQARTTIRRAEVPRLAYRRIVRFYQSSATHPDLRLDIQAGTGAADVLQRRSGRSLSDPVPRLYTRPVFEEVTGTDALAELAREYEREQWVWGEAGVPSTMTASAVMAAVIRLYEDDYIAQWDDLVNDVIVRPLPRADTPRGLRTLSDPNSPLRGFYQTVTEHTRLVTPPERPEGDSGPSFVGRVTEFVSGQTQTAPEAPPGTRVTEHFKPIHDLVEGAAGSPAPIDGVLGQMRQIQQVIEETGPRIGGSDPADVGTQRKIEEGARAMNDSSVRLPDSFRSVIRQVGELAVSSAAGGAREALLLRYRQEVVSQCEPRVNARYPFSPESPNEILIEDFAHLFRPDGVFDAFFAQQLDMRVDRTGSSWSWRPGGSLGLSSEIPRQFERAREIRDTFFPGGAATPQISFTLAPEYLDQAVGRFRLEVGGESLIEYRHGPVRSPTKVVWPSRTPGAVVATFEDGSAAPPYLEQAGAWAWFRIVGGGGIERISRERYLVSLQKGGRTVRLEMGMTSVINPFAEADLFAFRCDAS